MLPRTWLRTLDFYFGAASKSVRNWSALVLRRLKQLLSRAASAGGVTGASRSNGRCKGSDTDTRTSAPVRFRPTSARSHYLPRSRHIPRRCHSHIFYLSSSCLASWRAACEQMGFPFGSSSRFFLGVSVLTICTIAFVQSTTSPAAQPKAEAEWVRAVGPRSANLDQKRLPHSVDKRGHMTSQHAHLKVGASLSVRSIVPLSREVPEMFNPPDSNGPCAAAVFVQPRWPA